MCFAWRRERQQDSALDWRRVDPAGEGFRPCSAGTYLSEHSIGLQNGLGLTFSVQDWLEVLDGWVFLEVNPQGQWLFLLDTVNVVAPALARHLRQQAFR